MYFHTHTFIYFHNKIRHIDDRFIIKTTMQCKQYNEEVTLTKVAQPLATQVAVSPLFFFCLKQASKSSLESWLDGGQLLQSTSSNSFPIKSYDCSKVHPSYLHETVTLVDIPSLNRSPLPHPWSNEGETKLSEKLTWRRSFPLEGSSNFINNKLQWPCKVTALHFKRQQTSCY